MIIKVDNNNIERSIHELKRRLIREGVFKELKKRRTYLKPSMKRRLKTEDAEKTRFKDYVKQKNQAKKLL